MQVDHDTGRTGFLDGLRALRAAAEGLDDDALLAPSRCHGWTAGDVLVHVHLGLQEMLLGVVSPTDEPADTDAVSYWRPPGGTCTGGTGPVGQVRFVRAVGASYERPTGIVAHLRPTADALDASVAGLAEGVLAVQGRTMRTGDFLATWALELAVHHLDLGTADTGADTAADTEADTGADTGADTEADTGVLPPAPTTLALARRIVEALAGEELPWDDKTAVLIGAGRLDPDEEQSAEAGALAAQLPVIGSGPSGPSAD